MLLGGITVPMLGVLRAIMSDAAVLHGPRQGGGRGHMLDSGFAAVTVWGTGLVAKLVVLSLHALLLPVHCVQCCTRPKSRDWCFSTPEIHWQSSLHSRRSAPGSRSCWCQCVCTVCPEWLTGTWVLAVTPQVGPQHGLHGMAGGDGA